MMHQRDRQILQIAIPAIVTNITVPLLGLVDTAIVGHMGDAAYIGAIAVGSMIFNLVYWIFGFLRMGTSGMTAQAYGRENMADAVRLLKRALAIAVGIALLIIILQRPLCQLMLTLIGPTADVRPWAATYFYIVVWGAPPSLALFALTGWYIGMQNTRIPMLISILQNIINIAASLLLVYAMGMKVEGVALGTVVAQYAGLLVALVFLWRHYRHLFSTSDDTATSTTLSSAGDFFRVNRDIFLRTLFLVAVNLYFTSAGARQGAVILAVNTLLMQLYLLLSYIMDGFAYAGEALGGRYWGAHEGEAFRDVVRRLFRWGAGMTLLFTAVYVVGGQSFLHLLTDEPSVVEASASYVGWAYLLPVAGVGAFIWDGIFIGITATRGMLLSSVLAAIVFFGGVATLTGPIGNHGLWLSMIVYLAIRGIVQTGLFCNRIAKSGTF